MTYDESYRELCHSISVEVRDPPDVALLISLTFNSGNVTNHVTRPLQNMQIET